MGSKNVHGGCVEQFRCVFDSWGGWKISKLEHLMLVEVMVGDTGVMDGSDGVAAMGKGGAEECCSYQDVVGVTGVRGVASDGKGEVMVVGAVRVL